MKLDSTKNENANKGIFLATKQWDETWAKWQHMYDLGFGMVPAAARTKLPAKGYGFKHLRSERLTPEAFDGYRRRFWQPRSCDMVLCTGDTPGTKVVVVDPDSEEAEGLFRERCPESPMQTRTRRGRHRYFRHPGNGWIGQIIKLKYKGKQFDLDVKADGNIVVAPGSLHEKGHLYDWVDPWTPEMLASLPVYDPAWLPQDRDHEVRSRGEWNDYDHDHRCDEESTPMDSRIDRASRYAAACPGTTSGEGVASNAALRLAGKIAVGFLLPYDEAVEVMDHWGGRKDQNPEWTTAEIEHKVQDAIRTAERYPGEPGDMLTKTRSDYDPSGFLGEEYVRRETEVETTVAPPAPATYHEAGEESEGSKRGRPTVSAQIVVMVRELAALLQDTDGTPYARVSVARHRETMAVNGTAFKSWIGGEWYRRSGRPAKSDQLKEAIAIIGYDAQLSPREAVHLRWTFVGDRVYLDLGDPDWHVVEVSPEGWRVLSDSPVVFRRTANMAALPRPIRGGSLDYLRPFFTGDDEAYVLYRGAILAAVTPGSYFVTCIHGEQGSAKSWACKFVRRLLDPVGKVEMVRLPRDITDDVTKMVAGRYVVTFDNVSSVSPDASDFLCTLSTGGGHQARQLYTDDDFKYYEYIRPVWLNGIPDFTERPDLADRALTIHLPILVDKEEEDVLESRFGAALPGILGGLLDAVVYGLNRYEDTPKSGSFRMARAVRWVDACAGNDSFSTTYATNREVSAQASLDASPLTPVLIAFLKAPSGVAGGAGGHYEGRAAELSASLQEFITRRGIHTDRNFPIASNRLGGELRRISPSLRKMEGIVIHFDSNTKRKRWTISLPSPGGGRTDSAAPSEAEGIGTPVSVSVGYRSTVPSTDTLLAPVTQRFASNGIDVSVDFPFLEEGGNEERDQGFSGGSTIRESTDTTDTCDTCDTTDNPRGTLPREGLAAAAAVPRRPDPIGFGEWVTTSLLPSPVRIVLPPLGGKTITIGYPCRGREFPPDLEYRVSRASGLPRIDIAPEEVVARHGYLEPASPA